MYTQYDNVNVNYVMRFIYILLIVHSSSQTLDVCASGACSWTNPSTGIIPVCTNTATSCTLTFTSEYNIGYVYSAAPTLTIDCAGTNGCRYGHYHCGNELPPNAAAYGLTEANFTGLIDDCYLDSTASWANLAEDVHFYCSGNVKQCRVRGSTGDSLDRITVHCVGITNAAATCSINCPCCLSCTDAVMDCTNTMATCSSSGGVDIQTSPPTEAPTTSSPTLPTKVPTGVPTKNPTMYPTNIPTTSNPTTQTPTSLNPTDNPTKNPTKNPTANPTTKNPTDIPSKNPTANPTTNPTKNPTANPTKNPTKDPTTNPTKNPTTNPTKNPTANPTKNPTTKNPTLNPTKNPSKNPTINPTKNPSKNPTNNPTTKNPTENPSKNPTENPTTNPTIQPTLMPTYNPTINPSNDPTVDPTIDPTTYPTKNPTKIPTYHPTFQPTLNPTANPTHHPTTDPTIDPTSDPTKLPNIPIFASTGESGAIVSISTTDENNQRSSITNNSVSFLKEYLVLIILCVSTCIICCLIFFIMRYVFCYAKHKADIDKNNMELTNIASISSINPGQIEMHTSDGTAADRDENTTMTTSPQSDAGSLEPFSNDNALKMWLNNINLMVYYDLFVEQGFIDGTSAILELNSDDLREIGITKVAHRKLILKQISDNKEQILNVENIKNKNELNEGEDDEYYCDDDDEDADDLYDKGDKENGNTKGDEIIEVDEGHDLNKMYEKPLNSTTKK